jgi:thymidylate synthase
MSDGFPLLTTKKIHFKSIVGELLWFLKGSTDIRFLWENNCTIWDGDWYKKYRTTCSEPYTLEEVKQKVKDNNHSFHDSMFDMGPIYGKQWRSWDTWKSSFDDGYWTEIDQISNLINDLKTNPDSRRLMVNAWNVGELDSMVLPPCHNLFQMYSVEKKGKRHLSIMVNIRSNDVPLGLPFNIASYALLLEIIAKMVDMTPDELIINIGDAHIYLNQIEGVREQLTREPYPLPILKIVGYPEEYINPDDEKLFEEFEISDFKVENYFPHPSIKIPLSN